jgi:hypothetical protein
MRTTTPDTAEERAKMVSLSRSIKNQPVVVCFLENYSETNLLSILSCFIFPLSTVLSFWWTALQ